MAKRIGILTGGGDCPGLNAVIRGVVRKCLSTDGVECVGILRGWRGLLDALARPLTMETVSGILPRGGTILGTTRTNPFAAPDGPDRIAKSMMKFGLDAVIAIGGYDVLSVAHQLYSEHKLPVVGVPKTVDNDVMGTEYTFGFDTTVNIAMEAIDRIHTTAEAHDRVMIVEVMGRSSGWIALYAGLAAGADFILIPERPFKVQDVCDAIMRRHDRGKDFSIVVVAEGARISTGSGEPASYITQDSEVDEFGHVRFGGVGTVIGKEIGNVTGYETRVTVLGHTQRGGAPSGFDRVLGTRFGVKAAELAMNDEFGQMTAFRADQIVGVSLAEAAKGRKTVPDEFFDVAKVFFG